MIATVPTLRRARPSSAGPIAFDEFAERWGRRVRNDIAADANMLGFSLSEDSKAAARWSLAQGGEYYSVGAGVGISGFRANLGVGDDLFGSREDAYSDTVRQKRWDWYVDDFRRG